MRHPHVPRTWTGREALAVAEWLQQLADDVLEIYSVEIRVELLAREFERDAGEPGAGGVGRAAAEDLSPF